MKRIDNDCMKIALVGNPNCGKSSLFNVLTGLNQKVGNYPGVTVDRKSGEMNKGTNHASVIIDLPGIYSLYPTSEDEQIACDIIRNPNHEDHADVWVVVADATQLRRSLLLCTQMMDMQLPVVLAVNMMDLIEDSDRYFNFQKLSSKLDIPIVPISARTKKGIDTLKSVLNKPIFPSRTRVLKIPEGLQSIINQSKILLNSDKEYPAYQALITPDNFLHLPEDTRNQIKTLSPLKTSKELIANEMLVRYDRIDLFLEDSLKIVTTQAERRTLILDKIFLHPIWGYFIFIGILFMIFQMLFSVAEFPMNFIEMVFGEAGEAIGNILPADSMFSHFITDGVLAGIAGIVVFVPQIAFLFLFISVLEETGYMSRVVFLMDRVMRPFGFSGRSVIPLIGGMACAVPSIMMARTIPNPKERLITILVTPLMSCSARLPVYVLLTALFVPDIKILGGLGNLKGVVMLGLYIMGFVMALLVAFILKKMMKYQSDGIFVSEMPLYRKPRWQNVGITIWKKTRAFLIETGKIILVISVVLWGLKSFAPGKQFEKIHQKYEQLAENPAYPTDSLEMEKSSELLKVSYAGVIGKSMEPLIRPLGYDWKIGIALLTSFAAREVFTGTMGMIYGMSESVEVEDDAQRKTLTERISKEYPPAVAFSLLIFYAFAMQCMSTLAVTKRETGSWKWTFFMLIYLTVLAYGAAFIAYRLALMI